MMALEEVVLHIQIVGVDLVVELARMNLVVEVAGMDLVVEVAGMDLVVLARHLCQLLGILFLVGAMCVVIQITLLMSAPTVVSDLFSTIHLSCIEGKPGCASRTFLFFFLFIIMHMFD